MVFGRRDTEKARARWAKLKRFVKSGAYLDDWSAPVSLVTVANTIQRMNHKEKTMIEKGVSVYINTSRSGPPDTARSKLSRTSGSSETSETKIIDRFQKELSKRDLALSSKSMSRPVLISSNRKRRPTVGTLDTSSCKDIPEFEYDKDEDVKLEDIKSMRPPKRRLYKTNDLYYAACSFCKVTPVSNFLKQCRSFRVDLKNSFMSAQDVKAISIALVRDNRISSLDISGNEIGAIGIMYIAEMMVENRCIIDLNISGTIPGKEGLETLADLLKNNKSLRILRLEDNRIEHTEMQYIIDIIENVPTLQELYLGHNALGFEGGSMLAKVLATNSTIKVLDLQWNQIRKDTAKSICKALGENQTLWTLNLSWNGLGKEGCIELAQSLKKNTRLTDLNILSNRIDMTSLRFLLHGLVQNKGLRYIQLGRNPITTEGAKAVIKAIQTSKCSRLEVIQLEDISIDDKFLELMQEIKETKSIRVTHGELIAGGNAVTEKEHDPHDLNRFDPVMVLVEYMRIDNLRLIDFFQYLDTGSRERLSKSNFRDGVANLGIPLTEHHLDIVMDKIDLKKDGVVDLEEFMTVHREVSRQITQRTTRAKSKKKEDEGLIGLRKILREIIEKRNKTNKEKWIYLREVPDNMIGARTYLPDGRQQDGGLVQHVIDARIAAEIGRKFQNEIIEIAQRKVSLAAAARITASRRFSISVSSNMNKEHNDIAKQKSRPVTSKQGRLRPDSSLSKSDRPPSSVSTGTQSRPVSSMYSESRPQSSAKKSPRRRRHPSSVTNSPRKILSPLVDKDGSFKIQHEQMLVIQ